MRTLAALTWDPQIRGFLILLTSFVILVGSVYLLLMTNLGTRLAFLVAVAGLSGWMMLLGLLWTLTPSGTGPKGRDPHWKVERVIAGELGPTAPKELADFPTEWNPLEDGNASRAEGQTAADDFFTKADEGKSFGFDDTRDYVVTGAYQKGGDEHHLFGINLKGEFLFIKIKGSKGITISHDPNRMVVQVRPNKFRDVDPVVGQPVPTPEADPSEPVHNVVLIRDLGTKRLPPFLVFFSSLLIFSVTCYALHRRDKRIWAAQAAAAG
jgi:hypothetical protein